ncbi:hypothetical protein [Candidatus Xenohaliotis californiensis]
MQSRKLAISIIEITIVLVVMGLISVSVLTGTALVEQAKVRAVNNELTGYQEAFYIFKVSYNCIPGDCSNATTVVPHDANCLAGGTGGNDGDGNGMITTTAETRYFWCHLALSGVDIPNLTYGTDDKVVPGKNVPKSRGVGGGYAAAFLTNAGDTSAFSSNGLILYNIPDSTALTASNALSNDVTGAITPNQAKAILNKYDVPKATEGNYRLENENGTETCFTNATGVVKTGKSAVCILIYRIEQE